MTDPRRPPGEAELDAFVRRVIERIHERYDAMREKLRRAGQDAQDAERKGQRPL